MNQVTTTNGNNTPITQDKLSLLKNMFLRDCSNEEFEVFVHACQRTGLDPFMKQIYAVKRKGVMTIQVGIDGYRLIAERTGKYSPGREATYCYDAEGRIISATSYVKKMTQDGTWHEIGATAYFCEYAPSYRDQKTGQMVIGDFWKRMGHTMIAKCAEALALRKAFPGDLSGIYTKEEMEQADPVIQPAVIEDTRPIDKNDIFLLKKILSECDPVFVKRVWNALVKEEIISVEFSYENLLIDENYSKITYPVYERIKISCIQNIKDYQAKKESQNGKSDTQ